METTSANIDGLGRQGVLAGHDLSGNAAGVRPNAGAVMAGSRNALGPTGMHEAKSTVHLSAPTACSSTMWSSRPLMKGARPPVLNLTSQSAGSCKLLRSTSCWAFLFIDLKACRACAGAEVCCKNWSRLEERVAPSPRGRTAVPAMSSPLSPRSVRRASPLAKNARSPLDWWSRERSSLPSWRTKVDAMLVQLHLSQNVASIGSLKDELCTPKPCQIRCIYIYIHCGELQKLIACRLVRSWWLGLSMEILKRLFQKGGTLQLPALPSC